MRRPRAEILCAARRVAREKLEPVADLAGLLGHPARTVERWVVSGYRGVYLDGLHRPGAGWLTSHAACLRFLRALWERDELEHEALLAGAEQAREEAAERERRGIAEAVLSRAG